MRVGMCIVALLNSMQTAMLITAFRIIVPPCRSPMSFPHVVPSRFCSPIHVLQIARKEIAGYSPEKL